MERFMIRNVWLAGVGLTALVFMQMSLACAANVKIGLIDTQRIMQESRAAKQARRIFLKDLEKKRGVLKDKLEEVRALQEKLKSEAGDMSPSDRRAEGDRLALGIKAVKRLKADLEEELKKKDVELTRNLLGEIRKICRDYTKEKGYTVILEKKSVVAYDEAADITDKIIGLYDTLKE